MKITKKVPANAKIALPLRGPAKAVATCIATILKEIGEDPTREGLVDTPQRVARAYEKIFSGYGQTPEDILTTFTEKAYDEMIVAKDIEFFSMCEHHMLPFFGKAHIGYIPNGKVIGLSKLPRVLDLFARRLQNQERLTVNVAETLRDLINPRGVGVVLEAKHLCIMARGVEKQGSTVLTSSMLGLFKKNFKTRNEFLKLIGK